MTENKNKITVKEVIDQAEEEVRDGTSAMQEELYQSIADVLRELNGNGYSGKNYEAMSTMELSRIQGHLAGYKSTLADVISTTKRNYEIHRAYVNLRKANLGEHLKTVKVNGKNPSEKHIDRELRRMLFKDYIKEAYKEELYNKALYKWRALNSWLDVITSRIHVLQSQGADVHINDDLNIN